MREAPRRPGLLAAGLAAALLARPAIRRLRQADLSGKVALITGGSRGLGLLLARELARQGCRIAICARDQRELDQARRELERRGAEVFTAVCDIADRSQLDRMVDDVTQHYGRIDVLVNNAGIIQVGPLDSMTDEDFRMAMDIMFWGVVYPTLAVLPQMRERRSGWIVNITSIGGKVSVPHLLPYGCAKFAAVGFSEGLRAELAGQGISVTTIAPGLMRTGSYLNALFKGRHEREFTWFSLGAALPGISMDAERAARQIVEAARRGDSERILTLPANLLARFHGLFPGLTADILGLVNRLILPGPADTETGLARGEEVSSRLHSNLLGSLTALGRRAAERFNEQSEP
jgi:NAD(P)-dependent dehydrogenase (short-subunit alcohol dehydrogenase family)